MQSSLADVLNVAVGTLTLEGVKVVSKKNPSKFSEETAYAIRM